MTYHEKQKQKEAAQLTHAETLQEIRRCAGIAARYLESMGAAPSAELQRIENLASRKLKIDAVWPVADVGR